ncbi:hypothetical protein L7F22_040695 [Adiantum nelumboides]|nr:hypothetical protein [Adiantum nelumboides]
MASGKGQSNPSTSGDAGRDHHEDFGNEYGPPLPTQEELREMEHRRLVGEATNLMLNFAKDPKLAKYMSETAFQDVQAQLKATTTSPPKPESKKQYSEKELEEEIDARLARILGAQKQGKKHDRKRKKSTDFPGYLDVGPLVRKSNDPRLAELEDVAQVVSLLNTACRDVGFFYAKGHGLPTGLSEAVLRVSRQFFDCTYEEKIKIKLSSSTGFRGYQVVGQNVTKGKPDLHEAIDCYKEFDQNAYGELGKPLCAPNLWPEKPYDFKVVMEEYIQKMQDLAQKILKGIALALGGPADAFENTKAGDPFWVMRVIGYPPIVNHVQTVSFDDSSISWYVSKL